MAKRDYYEVLGIDKNADANVVKRAYRKMAKQYHPDANDSPDAEDKFKEIQEAYEVLGDSQKKANYDRFGHSAFEQGGAGSHGAHGFDFDDLGDIFGSFFGGGFGGGSRRQRANAPVQGDDTYASITINFLEAAHGCNKEVEILFEEECDQCHGSGAKSSSDIETCPTCHGSGMIQEQVRTALGTMVNQRVCPTCQGSGKKIKNKCPKCSGVGSVKKRIKVELKIPEGINEGQRLRVNNKGQRGQNGGPYGDLYVEIRVKKHEFFIREDNDIILNVPISISDAVLGTKIDVPTIFGEVEFSIPEGTQSQTKFRLKNKGVKDIRGRGQGNQYVIIEVITPAKVSREERDLYEQLRTIEKKKDDSIFNKLKKKWNF